MYGKILLLNGQVATSLTMGAKVPSMDQFINFAATVKVSNGIVELEFNDEIIKYLTNIKPDPGARSFWFYYLAKDLLDNFIFTKELTLNKCLLFLPEYYTQNGNNVYFESTQLKDNTIVDELMFTNLLASNPKFRDGVRDYHTGLLDVKNCPSHFYRAVESFKHLIIGKDGTLSKSEFEEFQKKINLNEKEKELLDKLYNMAKRYRHGERGQPIENYLELMYIAKVIILKTANCLWAKNQKH